MKEIITAFPPEPPTEMDFAARERACHEGIPVVLCASGPDGPTFREPEFGTWKFMCPHCRHSHNHGAGEGFRIAHCADPSSPYRDSGYYLMYKEHA